MGLKERNREEDSAESNSRMMKLSSELLLLQSLKVSVTICAHNSGFFMFFQNRHFNSLPKTYLCCCIKTKAKILGSRAFMLQRQSNYDMFSIQNTFNNTVKKFEVIKILFLKEVSHAHQGSIHLFTKQFKINIVK